MDQGLKQLLSQGAVIIVITAFAIGFWWYDKRRKRQEKKQNDVRRLKSGKVSAIADLNIPWTDELDARISQWIFLKNGRLIEGQEGELICYLNERGKSAFRGLMRVETEALPTRIIFLNKSGSLSVRLDEDWGFQLFIGPAKYDFETRYRERLQSLIKELGQVLNS
ncbi:MAG: hypothetical protein N4A46_04510 [Schleiferiaceae bacterium]|nr:hypothetical protein [Schleiferiaceae bacterium]